MHTQTSPTSSSQLIAAAAGRDPRRHTASASGPSRRWPAAAAAGLVALAAAFALMPADSTGSRVTQELEAFQHRVMADTASPGDESPAVLLSRRYLDTLPPAQRQQISDQVRLEQRAGVTEAGHAAFVLRRLELYEEALQQSRRASASTTR